MNKPILRLASLGTLILLILPSILHADHFRYGTMSWEPVDDNGTIRLKMQNGWSADHTFIRDYTAGQYKLNAITISRGDGDTDTDDIKVLSRDNTSNDSITEMGDNSSSSSISG